MRTIFSRDIYRYSPLEDITLIELARIGYINSSYSSLSNSELGIEIEKYNLGRHYLLDGIRIVKSNKNKLMNKYEEK